MKQRIIKLTSSAYKLLEFFPEADPLKSRAKEKVLLIMEGLFSISESDPCLAEGSPESGRWVSFKDYFSNDRERIKISILQDIDVLLGYFEVARHQEWVNRINCLIICNEYEKIKEKINLRPLLADGSVESKQEKSQDSARQGPLSPAVSARQEKILEFLSKYGKAQVMDLKTALLDVTKRTIRRDLDELMKLGRVQRMGEFNKVFYRLK